MGRMVLVALFVLTACLRAPAVESDLAVVGVTLIDLETGEVLPDRTILVNDGRIVAVGPRAELAAADGAEVVDADGLYVIPGLWDTHVHSAANTDWHFPLLVAHGVTSVRNLHATVDTSLALTQAVKRRLGSGELLGPRLLANGGVVDGSPPVWPGSVVAETPEEGRAAVDSLVDGGADFIKVYDRLRTDVYDAVARRASERGIPLDGHVPFDVPPTRVAEAGQRTIEHASGIGMGCATNADSLRAAHHAYVERVGTMSWPENEVGFFRLARSALEARDEELCRATIDAYVEHGVAVTPTLVAFMGPELLLADTARLSMIPADFRESWSAMAAQGPHPVYALMTPVRGVAMENRRMLYEAGVPFLAGTDLGNPFLVPGVSLHDELEALVRDVGMSPLDALRAATLEPARVFGLADSLGTVEPGMLADLVLLRANPLTDIRHSREIAGVVMGGRYFAERGLDSLIASAAASSSRSR